MKKYKKNLVLESYSDLLSEEELMEQFDNMLDEDGPIDVCGSTFNPSFILKKCDPIKYNILFTDYKDELEESVAPVEETVETEEDMPSETDNVISDDIANEMEILLSSFDNNIFLGVLDGIYYIKTGEFWEEIPATTYEEATDYYNNELIEAKSQQEFADEDELNINAECNKIWESRQLSKKNQSLI
jgi:hypothetical protein